VTAQPPVILFVPGIRAKPPADVQQEQLRRCLEAALHRRNLLEAAELSGELQVVGWSQRFYGEDADIAPDLPGIDRLLSGLGDVDKDRRDAARLGGRLIAAMYAIGDRFPLLSSLFASQRMESRMDEINRYFRNPQGERDQICNLVKQHLRDAWSQGRRVVLIGHSFGSVIAYDALWELTHIDHEGAAHKVDLFISMGSPLTMSYVRRRLRGAGRQGHGRYPCNIKRWLNLAALGEVTALDRKMSHCFAEMMKLNIVDSIEDNLAVLNRFRDADGLNVHKCYGYMSSDTVAATLADISQQA